MACEQALHLGDKVKLDAREARKRRRESGGVPSLGLLAG